MHLLQCILLENATPDETTKPNALDYFYLRAFVCPWNQIDWLSALLVRRLAPSD